MIVRLMALALAATLVAAPAETAAQRQPTDKWVVEFADHECLMSRQYGTDDHPLILAIKKMPMGNVSTLLVIHDGKNKALTWGKGRLSFSASDTAAEVDAGSTALARKPLRRTSMPITDDQLKLADQAGRIGIMVPGELDEEFHLSSLSEVLKLGDKCAVELGEDWGFSAEEQARIQTPPKGDAGKVVRAGDYPDEALRNGEQGTVEARVIVGADGKPTDCVVFASSGSTSLDETTCRIATRRGHFSPAIDVDGKPVRGLVTISIRWSMF